MWVFGTGQPRACSVQPACPAVSSPVTAPGDPSSGDPGQRGRHCCGVRLGCGAAVRRAERRESPLPPVLPGLALHLSGSPNKGGLPGPKCPRGACGAHDAEQG